MRMARILSVNNLDSLLRTIPAEERTGWQWVISREQFDYLKEESRWEGSDFPSHLLGLPMRIETGVSGARLVGPIPRTRS